MPTDERRGWSPRRWGGGGRPPWWPEGEPWPPQGGPGWRRGRFMRRIGCFVVLLLLVMAAGVAGVAWAVGTLFSHNALTGILSALALVIWIVVVVALGRRIGTAARPLADLSDAAGRVEAGEAGVQVEVRGPREVRSMASAFNAMSARLAEDRDERRRLLADVSHELRTPLTVVQGNIEGMLDGIYPADREHLERVLAETRQLERLIEDLRTLSLADAGALPLHREPTDLAALATEVVAGFEAQAAAAGVRLTVEADAVPALELDPQRMRQVIGNLLSNAVRHTPDGGRVTARVGTAPTGAFLEVSDTGTGMDPDAAAHAFDRFWRSGDSAGAGLGLAIVRDLVRAHGGEVSLVSAPGRGTTVRCGFPDGP